MLPFQSRRKHRRYVIGSGLMDWIPAVTRAIGAAGRFITANKGAIKNIADVTGSVAKAGASTVTGVKQIIDAMRSKRPNVVSKAPEKVLSEKSFEILTQLANPVGVQGADISSRIDGAGFRRLKRTQLHVLAGDGG